MFRITQTHCQNGKYDTDGYIDEFHIFYFW